MPAQPSNETQSPVIPADIAAMPYEQAKNELGQVVQQLETGNCSLEDSMALWERGEHLARHCQTLLDNAQTKLDAAGTSPNGAGSPETSTAATQPAQASE